LNFGGVFRAGVRHVGTGLTLQLNGFNSEKGLVTDLNGSLALVSDNGEIASEWSFAALMSLWKRKHAQAVYVPAEERKIPSKQYRYGPNVRLGVGTDFTRLIQAISTGVVYYDPAIKLENASAVQARTKRRSQFRVGSQDISKLYAQMTEVSVTG
jgi:MvaI/BcnI restriction endonuclease family